MMGFFRRIAAERIGFVRLPVVKRGQVQDLFVNPRSLDGFCSAERDGRKYTVFSIAGVSYVCDLPIEKFILKLNGYEKEV